MSDSSESSLQHNSDYEQCSSFFILTSDIQSSLHCQKDEKLFFFPSGNVDDKNSLDQIKPPSHPKFSGRLVFGCF